MKKLLQDKNFDTALSIISAEVKNYLINLPVSLKNETYEIRIRSGKPLVLCGKYGSLFLKKGGGTSRELSDACIISPETLSDIFNRLCCYSIHTHLPSILNGYITMQGGHRAGVCGTAVTDCFGNVTSVKDISSVNIRISREILGSADEIFNRILLNDVQSCIIAGGPSSGKTTILRDIVRQLSNSMVKVCVIDERQEIAAVNGNIPQKDVGMNTDVLSCYPKDKAILSAVKTMSPDLIAIDEIATEKEIQAIKLGVNSGVKFIVTVHASDYSEILHRPQIQALINTYSFRKLILLDKPDAQSQILDIFDVEDIRNEIIGRRLSVDKSVFSRNDSFTTA